jgi:UPF0755 protein
MSVFREGERRRIRRGFSNKWFFLPLLIILVVVVSSYVWFRQSLQPVDVSNETVQVITIDPGESEDDVSKELEAKGVIKSALAYRVQAKISGKQGTMKAGDYEVTAALSVDQILDVFSSGKVSVELVTILPAQTIAKLKAAFLALGYSQNEVETALNPATYANHPALANKPPSASLEGYLYPESFLVSAQMPLTAIVESSLDEMAALLSTARIAGLAAQGLSPHEGIIIASIVEKEVSIESDKPRVAQVFLKRYSLGMSLGSDVTAFYGSSLLGEEDSVFVDSPYNTRIVTGLPPGPISNITASSLDAVINPSQTDFLFFVAGDDGTTHFGYTVEEHESNIAAYCSALCE